MLEWSDKGVRHRQIRFAEFDEGHLKRVCRTCIRDGQTFNDEGKQRNLVTFRKGYEHVGEDIDKNMEVSTDTAKPVRK